MTGGNWLDRTIGYFSPEAGRRRMAARMKMEGMTRARAAYDGATRGHRSSGWRVVSSDANAETLIAGGRLRDVARDLYRNNPLARKGASVLQNNIVGSGIIPQARARTKGHTKRIEDLARQHLDTTDIDAAGQHDFYGLQWQTILTVVVAGECLIRRRRRRSSDGLALPFQLQVLEPDFLDTMVDGRLGNGNTAVQGVEFDKIGRRVAYWLFDEHPGQRSVYTLGRSRRVPARDVAHVYRIDRPGQVRGVSWFAPVIVKLNDFADFTDAYLVRQKIAACFAAFWTGDDPYDGDGEESDGGFQLESLEPGMIERLPENANVHFANPPQVQGFTDYARFTGHEIAAGLEIPYWLLTGDLSQFNYSSGRMGWLEFHRCVDAWQSIMFVPMMCRPAERWFNEAAAVVTASTEPVVTGWTPPAREMIDPAKEIKAASDAIRAGLSSRSEQQRRRGHDPEVLEAEIAEDNRRADDAGLVFDSDPRHGKAAAAAPVPEDDPEPAPAPPNSDDPEKKEDK